GRIFATDLDNCGRIMAPLWQGTSLSCASRRWAVPGAGPRARGGMRGDGGMPTPNQSGGGRKTARYGWKPGLPDPRGVLDWAPAIALAALPTPADLRGGCPPVYDQGRIGSCTANAIAAAFEFDLKKQNLTDFMPSRLFIYYNERAMEGHVQFDSGAQIRD